VGRLFWKFFFFIMVAQMTTTFGVGIMFSLENRDRDQRSKDLDLSPPAAFLIKSAVATLQYGTSCLRAASDAAFLPSMKIRMNCWDVRFHRN